MLDLDPGPHLFVANATARIGIRLGNQLIDRQYAIAGDMGRHSLVLGGLVGLLLVAFANARTLAVAYPLLLVTSVALIIVTSTAISVGSR